MPPQTQRRRRTGNREEEDEPRRRQMRRQNDSDESEESEQDEDGDVDMGGSTAAGDEELIKKLVRYALACDYARMPIRRDGIRDKVLGNNARSFKRVFDGAQEKLLVVFGMEMSELPLKEKRSLKEKQKATQRKAPQSTSKQYILTSTLPKAYKAPAIIAPSRLPSPKEEAEYVGFYTFLISLIVLSGGELSDLKLKRHLERMNAKDNTPIDKTANVLAKLVRQGYLDKVVEKSDHGEDESVTWCIGPRAKVEVPRESIAAFVREVFCQGQNLPEDFDKKLVKSLGLNSMGEVQEDSSVEAEG